MSTPLAERMRPNELSEYIGQRHLLEENGALKKAIESKILPSIIFWGPPGVGKTTLANLLAKQLNRPFYTLSAISSGVKDIREIIQKAESQGMFQTSGAVLFIDEIHRFSKSQQDSLLGAVEKGTITLIGATTENPSFEVISALLSRCQVYTLESHTLEDLLELINRAIKQDILLSKRKIELREYKSLIAVAGGDARKMLNLLELVVNTFSPSETAIITDELVNQLAQQRVRYDKDGEQHYDIISAFIKSIRGSDPDGAVYWLARMIEGGEDPKFIARRLLISAAEDVGLANPTALIMANNTFQAIQVIGWPEARIILSQCAIYLATSPKGNAAYIAIDEAISTVKQDPNAPVPLHLRNAPTKLMKDLGYGAEYQYAHDFPGNFVFQQYLPDSLKNRTFFHAGSSAREQEINKQLQTLWPNKFKK
ncbi:replication-associated recombination protein A [Fluviicola taffensis]|uniref:Replication-associated recombination protein A n=1 Tax=Fluviicola taffensis (strain DSM 16823 / NCIMB 13979 / RW262) TaxID=755732 RepID=F2IBM9_FLUTR|nr:replication-associated recombination protein A [Fluviicola taffensis]AEA45355.1 AAA ATPase central domain protein [Fluviicola taffensis DSM 16823]